jgi:hypothetical protein
MTPPPLERHLLRAVVDRLKLLQAFDKNLVFRKRHGSAHSMSGDPDLYGVWAGIPFEIELKPASKRLTELQAARLEEWQRAGAQTFVVHSLPELESALDQIHPNWRQR